ncbi:MAG: ABC transporter ATP-binding protein [Nitrospinota bacterium]
MEFFEAKNLIKYFGGLAAVNGVSFKVEKGEIFGLIGPNGSGKTTIFNLISGFHKPTTGAAYFKGNRVSGLKPHKINHMGIARTFQVVKPLKRMSVMDNVIAAAFCRANTMHHAKEIAEETLEFCSLMHRRDFIAKSLTIGDRKRLEITRAMATKPELILLDETFAGLNPTELDPAIELIKKIRDNGSTIIIVEHIMKVIMSISDRIHAINFGQTITEGTPREVASHKEVIEAYLGEPLEESHH